jgi:hypothetical protein
MAWRTGRTPAAVAGAICPGIEFDGPTYWVRKERRMRVGWMVKRNEVLEIRSCSCALVPRFHLWRSRIGPLVLIAARSLFCCIGAITMVIPGVECCHSIGFMHDRCNNYGTTAQ